MLTITTSQFRKAPAGQTLLPQTESYVPVYNMPSGGVSAMFGVPGSMRQAVTQGQGEAEGNCRGTRLKVCHKQRYGSSLCCRGEWRGRGTHELR
jgi:hypothetical protein